MTTATRWPANVGASGPLTVLLGSLLHFVLVSLSYAVFLILQKARRFRHILIYLARGGEENSDAVVRRLEELAGEFSHRCVPTHLGIAVQEKNVSFEDVSRLLLWCSALQLKYVTVFDVSGQLKANIAKLKLEVTKRLVKDNYQSRKLVFDERKQLELVNQASSSNANDYDTMVKVIDQTDGRPRFVEIVKQICLDSFHGKKHPETLQLSDIDFLLRGGNMNKPDPQLVILFGPVLTTAGFLPWEINHSEFVQLYTHKGIMLSEFLEGLQKYGKIEKRFGK